MLLTLDEIKERLADRKIRKVAQGTGLHPNTIYAFARGKANNPALATVQALSDYLTNGKAEVSE